MTALGRETLTDEAAVPAGKPLDALGQPTAEIDVALERKALIRVEMGGRGQRDVGDGWLVAGDPARLVQAGIQDAGKLVEVLVLRGDDRHVGRVL